MALTTSRIFVYGSCVARDTIGFLDESFSLVGYTARQSMISGMSPPVELPAEPDLDSAFQARMVREDFASSIARRLPEIADSLDLLLLDLIDERLDVIALPGGGHVTRSLELVQSGLLDQLPDARTLPPFGSRGRYRLWEPHALRFVDLLRETGLLERTLLIDATFAALTDTGEPVKKWRNNPAATWTRAYRPYADLLAESGVRVHRITEPEAISSTSHQWGPAPYHYVDSTYLAVTNTIAEMTGD